VAFRVASWRDQRAAQGDLKIAMESDSNFMAFIRCVIALSDFISCELCRKAHSLLQQQQVYIEQKKVCKASS
jgi:hypothetical protein